MIQRLIVGLCGLFLTLWSHPGFAESIDEASAGRFAALALACVHQEYPNHISLTLTSDADAAPPHILTPAFYGCIDWHSAVHGHWLLVRLLKQFPNAPFAAAARSELARSLTPAAIAGEVGFLKHEGRSSFERPYGLAWLLKLSAELKSWNDPDGREWATTLQPLETEASQRIKLWLLKLNYPIRTGAHDQTAFSFGLMWDWATDVRDEEMHILLTNAALKFYGTDRDCPLTYEPSGEDFLSPCLAEADLMRRLLDQPVYSRWLVQLIPQLKSDTDPNWLPPAVVTDRADPKLAHLDGLNLSRAWMLEGIASALPAADRRRAYLLAAAAAHRSAALPFVTGEHYEGAHWLATFAVYLTSEAGLPGKPED